MHSFGNTGIRSSFSIRARKQQLQVKEGGGWGGGGGGARGGGGQVDSLKAYCAFLDGDKLVLIEQARGA
jgi:hypothetical protein